MLAKRTTTPTVFSGALALLALYGCSLQDYDALGEGKEPGPKTEETEDETSTRETPSSSVNETVSSTASESTMDVDASVTTEGDSGVGETTQVTSSEFVTSDTTTSSEVPTTDEPTSTSEPTSSSSDESSGPPPPLVVEGNEIQNSSFEQPVLTGTLPGRWQVIGNAAAIVSNTVSHTGSRSWQCAGRTQNWEGPGINLLTILDPGITYVARAWVRMEANKPATFHMVRKALCMYEGGVEPENETTKPLIYNQLAAAFTVGDEWVQLESAPFTLRDCELNTFVLYFEGPGAGESFFLDDVAVIPYTP